MVFKFAKHKRQEAKASSILTDLPRQNISIERVDLSNPSVWSKRNDKQE